MSTQGTQVTLTVPADAPPGTILSIPVRGGSEVIKVRVPDGVGAGSSLVLTQAEGSEEWSLQLGSVVPAQEGQAEARDSPAQAQVANGATDLAIPPYQPVEPQPAPCLEGAVAHTVRLETSVGDIDIIVRPDWAPHGTRRFLELAAAGDLIDLAFYRAIKGCIVQFGLPARRPWPPIPDDPPTGVPFLLGAVSFAAIGENTRRSTLFICIGDMSHMLGQKSWETPIGAVAESSLDVLELIETGYGDIAEFGGAGPDTNIINTEGNAYLRQNFPRLSYIHSARPLDWQHEGAVQTPSLQPPVVGNAQPSPHARQTEAALQAAHEAHEQALHASQAAAQAAQAEHVAQAAQAAQQAREAAHAAQAAAEAAQAAQADLEEQRRRLEAQARSYSSTAVAASGVVQAAAPMYQPGTELAMAHALAGPLAPQVNPYTGQVEGPVDVPIEIRKPGARCSLAPAATALMPHRQVPGQGPGCPVPHAVHAGAHGSTAVLPVAMQAQVPGRPGAPEMRPRQGPPGHPQPPGAGMSAIAMPAPSGPLQMAGRPGVVAMHGPPMPPGAPGYRPPVVMPMQAHRAC